MIKDSRFTSGKGVISHAGRPLIASEHPLILYPRARSYIDPEVMSGVCRACVTFMLNEPAFAVTRTLRYIFCLGLLAAVGEATTLRQVLVRKNENVKKSAVTKADDCRVSSVDDVSMKLLQNLVKN